MLPPGWKITKPPAIHHGERQIVAEVFLEVQTYPDQVRAVQQAFRAATGWLLEFKGIPGIRPSTPVSKPAPAASMAPAVPQAAKLLDQNTAITVAKAWAQETGIPVHKIGLKQDHIGKLLELQFVSPEVGARYAEALQELANQVGFRCTPAKSPNQHVLAQLVRAALSPAWGLVGEPRLWIHEGRVQVRLVNEPEAAAWAEVCTQVLAQTGYALERA